MISFVLFDMDHVLCDYSRKARAAHLARLAGTTPEAVFAAIFTSGFEAEGDAGIVDSVAYLAGFGRRLGYPLTVDEWVEARRAGTAARREVLDLVRRLRVRSAVLTNNSALVTDHIDRIAPELPGVFGDRLFASASLGAAKPARACFERCLAALGEVAATTLFVDDLPENVAGAAAAGLQAHQYTSVEALAGTLREHGLLEG